MAASAAPSEEKASVTRLEASELVEGYAGLSTIKELEAAHDAPITEEDIRWISAFEADSQRVARCMRKVDIHVMPILILLYLIAFLDRSNIGNARIEGLLVDLKLSSQQFSWCLTIFFFAYGPTEIPANIMIKLVRPSIWLPSLMFLWGVILTLQGIVQNYAGLLATRWFLGMAEAGFFPGAVFMLSNWYVRGEMGRRVGYLYGAASLAGAFSGILAFGLAKMRGIAGLNGWRWIFIIEGIATCLIAVFTPFILPDSIERAKFLDADEKRYLARRIHADRQGRDKGPFKYLYVRQVITDVKILLMCYIFFAIGIATYGLSFTLPSIVRQLGYTSAQAQLLTIPPYACAVLCTFATAYLADRSRKRARWVIIPLLVAIAGFIIIIAAPKNRLPGVLLFGVFLVASGIYSAVPAVIAWMANNVGGEWKRGLATGLQIGIASCGGIIGSNVYVGQQAPKYPLGYGLSVSVLGLAVICAFINRWICKRDNARRDLVSEEEVRTTYSQEQLDDLGDASPLFRYEH